MLLFDISNKEKKRIKKWNKKHKGSICYTFCNNSGIGVSLRVHCSCGKSKDITDYSSW